MTITIDNTHVKQQLGQTVKKLVSHDNRVVVAVAGVPGSGKSTVAKEVCQYLQEQGIETAVVGMDGFHLTRDQLRQMPDVEYAFKRRGAPFTFDANGFVQFMVKLRQSCSPTNRKVIKAPSFDHSIKDPTPDDIVVPVSTQVVIVEGLYTLLDVNPWNQVPKLVDQTWFVNVDPAVARERLAKRHLAAGIEPDMEHAYARVDQNDTLNGEYILANLVKGIDIVID